MWVAFANAKATHILNKNISVYAIFNDHSFNDTLTNDIFNNFEQLGPDVLVCNGSQDRSFGPFTRGFGVAYTFL